MSTPTPEWQRGACVDRDPELWFPSTGSRGTVARAICRRCPIMTACRRFAVDRPELDGTWGATSLRERQTLRNPHAA